MDSDVDLVILVENISHWFNDTSWANQFGIIQKVEHEDWGPLKSLRCYYSNNLEVEFGFTVNSWASISPLDKGTQKVIQGGARILYDREGYFKALLEFCNSK